MPDPCVKKPFETARANLPTTCVYITSDPNISDKHGDHSDKHWRMSGTRFTFV